MCIQLIFEMPFDVPFMELLVWRIQRRLERTVEDLTVLILVVTAAFLCEQALHGLMSPERPLEQVPLELPLEQVPHDSAECEPNDLPPPTVAKTECWGAPEYNFRPSTCHDLPEWRVANEAYESALKNRALAQNVLMTANAAKKAALQAYETACPAEDDSTCVRPYEEYTLALYTETLALDAFVEANQVSLRTSQTWQRAYKREPFTAQLWQKRNGRKLGPASHSDQP